MFDNTISKNTQVLNKTSYRASTKNNLSQKDFDSVFSKYHCLSPLSQERLKELLSIIAKDSNSSKSQYERAFAMLVRSNLRLVFDVVRHSFVSSSNLEDAVSSGIEGLYKAINSFNPAKEVKFSVYASRCISNSISDFLKSETRILKFKGYEEALDEEGKAKMVVKPAVILPFYADQTDKDESYLSLEDIIPSKSFEEMVNDIDYRSCVDVVKRICTERELDIFYSVYGLEGHEPESCEAIGRRLGCTGQTVINHFNRIIAKVKRYCTQGYNPAA